MIQQSETVRFIILVIGFIALAMISQIQDSKSLKQDLTHQSSDSTLTVASLKIK